MAKYRYTSNKNADDGTEMLIPDPEDRDRQVRVGEEIELSDEEAARLRERFNLTKVSDESSEPEQRESAETGRDSGRGGTR